MSSFFLQGVVQLPLVMPLTSFLSQGIGEPPLLLACSVLCAIHDAVQAARIDEGLSPFVPINTPATPARIRMACSDRFTRLVSQVFQGFCDTKSR